MKGEHLLVGLLLSAYPVLAYIDPGTGSAVAGSIWPIILMIIGAIGAFFAKYFIRPVKQACLKIAGLIKK
jgi:hypothetical protein